MNWQLFSAKKFLCSEGSYTEGVHLIRDRPKGVYNTSMRNEN